MGILCPKERKGDGMPEGMTRVSRVVGAKQVRRALEAGAVETLWLAEDADPQLTEPLERLCAMQGVELEKVPTMKELGRSCGIAVGAAVAASLK